MIAWRRIPSARWVAAVTLAVSLAAGMSVPVRSAADAGAIRAVDTQRLSQRLVDVTMATDALPDPVHTRILLPDGYDARKARRYPVLYLLHGGYGSYVDWTTVGNAEAITAKYPLIVVMPEDGAGGWYTDWYNAGRGGPPKWETFDIRQLIPWVDRHFRTRSNQGGRAIAGLSTGGFGAMSLAARHPDLFTWAGSFSGAVDIVGNDLVPSVIGAEAVDDGGTADAPFGDRKTNEFLWRAHNPVDLASNLRGMALALFSGNGQPDPSMGATGTDIIEQQVHLMTKTFDARLTKLGIRHRFDDYGPGSHSWPYWQRDLERSLPGMLTVLGHQRAHRPRSSPFPVFSYRSGDRAFRVYGWSVRFAGPPRRFAVLSSRAGDRFALTWTGHAKLTTPAYFSPGSRHTLSVVSPRSEKATTVVRADGAGRIGVSLSHAGPPSRRVFQVGPP